MTSRNKNDVKKLFEYWCEIKQDGSIHESFPENFRDKITAEIPSFAFPCDLNCDTLQSYSFILTTDDSKFRYGFCRQDPKAKSAMVLMTYLPWHDTFLRLLVVLAEMRRPNVPRHEFRTFLTEVYNRGVPDADVSFEIFYNAGLNYFVFEHPKQFQLPSIPENHNLNLYYNFVEPKNMIAVFAAMLAERRIIFTSRRLDRLSSCIQAAHAFLYPMEWQHIFIPVLPMKLKDYLSAPMPYLIGVPIPVLETMTPEELGEVVIMNCDTKIFESPFDDVHELPNEIVSHLKKQLSNTNEHIGDRVSKIFLGVLVQLIGTYRDGVDFRETGKVFNRDRFIESRPSHLRPFLAKMMELQIFQQFIDSRLEMLNTGLGFSDEFEIETARYAEKMKKRGRFFQNVKDKTNPAVKSAVKSVKEGSRGVKTVYKDLKSKLRDIPSSTNFRSHLNANSPHDRIDGYQISKTNGTVAGHRSAPSSPVFSKRLIGVNSTGGFQFASPKLNGVTQQMRRGPTPLATSSSTAHIHTMAAHGVSHPVGYVGTSPTVSPASSVSSSDMNLSQELQNHPLFKTPVVDRSLKPSCGNIELLNTRIPAAAATITANKSKARNNNSKPNRPPPPVQYYNHPYMAQRSATHLQLLSTHPQPKHPPTVNKPPAMPRIQQAHTNGDSTPLISISTSTSSTSTINKIITTDSIFDNPPQMQSPPVPPRRQCSGNPSDTSSYASANCSDTDCFIGGKRSTASTISSSSSSSVGSFTSAMSSISQQMLAANVNAYANTDVDAPKPIPRHKREKESLRSLQPYKVQEPNALAAGSLNSVVHSTTSSQEDTNNDLISLEDSHNSSFDLEDFDPLNQNARPLPLPLPLPLICGGTTKNVTKSRTLPITAVAPSISNPVYPYFSPPHINGRSVLDITPPDMKPPPLPSSSPPRDDENELLRKYGLDQFTLHTQPQPQLQLQMNNDSIAIANGNANENRYGNGTGSNANKSVSNNLKAVAKTTTTTTTTTANRQNWTTFD